MAPPAGCLRRRALCLAAGVAAAALQWAPGRAGQGGSSSAGFAQGAPLEQPARALLSARRGAESYFEGRAQIEEARQTERVQKQGDKVAGGRHTGKWRGKKYMPIERYRELRKKSGRLRYLSRWTDPSPPRGESGRGKQNHFHLLDRYIRRIDSVVPEDMEGLVKPIGWEANMENTTKTIKFLLGPGAKLVNDSVIEQDIRDAVAPYVPLQVVTWTGWRDRPEHSPRALPPRAPVPGGRMEDNGEVHEAYAFFEANEDAKGARRQARASRDAGQLVAGDPADVRFTVNRKWFKVCEEVGVEAAGDPEMDAGIFAPKPDDAEGEEHSASGRRPPPGGWHWPKYYPQR